MDSHTPVDRASLERRALRYLDRFDATAARLALVLRRSVEQAIPRSDPERRNEAYLWCEQVVAHCLQAGLINDARYAHNTALWMRQRGASTKAVTQKLLARGIDRETALTTLQVLSSESGDNSELEAARALVRRRRLGYHRPESERRERRNKDLAALARAGFSFETAARALDPPDEDEVV